MQQIIRGKSTSTNTLKEERNAEETFANFANSGKFAKV